jgi:hypothetical protein
MKANLAFIMGREVFFTCSIKTLVIGGAQIYSVGLDLVIILGHKRGK